MYTKFEDYKFNYHRENKIKQPSSVLETTTRNYGSRNSGIPGLVEIPHIKLRDLLFYVSAVGLNGGEGCPAY